MKDDLKRLKAGALAVMLSFSLTGCASSNGFEFGSTSNREIGVVNNSAVNNTFIGKCYVAEVYNKLTECNELYIVSSQKMKIILLIMMYLLHIQLCLLMIMKIITFLFLKELFL